MSTLGLIRTSIRSLYRMEVRGDHGSNSTIYEYTNPDKTATGPFKTRGVGWQGECDHGRLASNTRGSRTPDRVRRAGGVHRTRPLVQQEREGFEPAPERGESLGPSRLRIRSSRSRSRIVLKSLASSPKKRTRPGIVTRPSAKTRTRAATRAQGRTEDQTGKRADERAETELGINRYGSGGNYRGGDPDRLAPVAARYCKGSPHAGLGSVHSLREVLT